MGVAETEGAAGVVVGDGSAMLFGGDVGIVVGLATTGTVEDATLDIEPAEGDAELLLGIS